MSRIYVEPTRGSQVESDVRCTLHGTILTRAAVLTTAIDSALRHHRTYHPQAGTRVVIESASADRMHWTDHPPRPRACLICGGLDGEHNPETHAAEGKW